MAGLARDGCTPEQTLRIHVGSTDIGGVCIRGQHPHTVRCVVPNCARQEAGQRMIFGATSIADRPRSIVNFLGAQAYIGARKIGKCDQGRRPECFSAIQCVNAVSAPPISRGLGP